MNTRSKQFFGWLLGSMIFLWGNDVVQPTSAKGVSEYIIERYQKRIDNALDRIDEFVRDFYERRRGLIGYTRAGGVAGLGPSCGVLPDKSKTACCDDPRATIWIEYSGDRDPYIVAGSRYKVVCK